MAAVYLGHASRALREWELRTAHLSSQGGQPAITARSRDTAASQASGPCPGSYRGLWGDGTRKGFSLLRPNVASAPDRPEDSSRILWDDTRAL